MWTSSGGFCPRSLKALICRNLPCRDRGGALLGGRPDLSESDHARPISRVRRMAAFGPDFGARSPSALTLALASLAGPPGWAESPEGFGVGVGSARNPLMPAWRSTIERNTPHLSRRVFKKTEMSRLDKRECPAFTFAIKIVLGRRPFYSAHAIAGAPLWPWNA